MKSLSVSFTLGKESVPKNINLKHNAREIIARNIDKKKVADNITYIQEDVEDSYNKLFGEAVIEYNRKQSRPARHIKNYFKHILEGKREEAYYEAIVQFGDVQTASCNSEIHISSDSLSCNYIFSYNLNDDSLCYTTFNIDYRSLGYENLKSHMEILAFTNALVYKLGNNYSSEYHNDNDNSYKDYCIKYKYTSEYKEKLKQEIISKMPLKKTH